MFVWKKTKGLTCAVICCQVFQCNTCNTSNLCNGLWPSVQSNTCIYSDHIPAVRNFNCSLCVVSFFKILICLLLCAHCTVCRVREGCRASEAGLSVRYYLITGIDKSRETAGDAFFTRLSFHGRVQSPQVQQLYLSNYCTYPSQNLCCSSPYKIEPVWDPQTCITLGLECKTALKVPEGLQYWAKE